MRFSSKHVQPMPIGKLLKQSIKLGKQIFLLSLPSNILIIIGTSSLAYLFYSYGLNLGVETTSLATIAIFNNLLFISVTGANVFNLLLQNGQQKYLTIIKKSLWNTFKIIPTILVATLLYAISVSMGLVLLIIPGLLLLGFFGLYTQVITLESKGIVTSLTRSWQLVKGSLAKVFFSIFTILLITNLMIILLAVLGDGFINKDHFWINISADLLAYIFIMPFIGSFLALLYLDSRASQEAFDLTTLKEKTSTY